MGHQNVQGSRFSQTDGSLYPSLLNLNSPAEPSLGETQSKAIKITWERTISQKTIEEITDFEQKKQASLKEGLQKPLKQSDTLEKLTKAQKRIFPSFLETTSLPIRPLPTLRPAAYQDNSLLESSAFIDLWDIKIPFPPKTVRDESHENLNRDSLFFGSEE